MIHVLWRIAVDAPTYSADDLTGRGAALSGGRWNAKDLPVVYSSPSQSLACLETVVHLGAGGLPMNRYLVRIEAPDAVWRQAESVEAGELEVGWDAEPAGRVSIAFGSDWIRSLRSPLLLVPSVIVPDEFNVLINPHHPASATITACKVRRWVYDPRLLNRL